MQPDLPDDYYLVNFRELLSFVSRAYADLLTKEEADFASDFKSLPEAAARLYVRLLCRSKTLFRRDKLNYTEIPDLDSAIQELAATRFMLINPELGVIDALSLMTKPEISQWLQDKGVSGCSKSALAKLKRADTEQIVIDSLQSQSGFAEPVAIDRLPCAGLQILQPCREEVFCIYKLCFFGNLYQDMTDFVLRDLGLALYENYRIDLDTRAFADRDQIEKHLLYYSVLDEASQLDELTANDALRLNKLLPCTDDATLLRRIDRFRNRLARDLERAGEWQAALELFAQSRRPPARERRARILAANERESDALDLCREVVAAPIDEEEKQVVGGFAARLAKKNGSPWEHEKPYKPPYETIVLENNGESVELQARDYFDSQGQCFYTENVLFDGVFGLAFWEQIFLALPGVFFNPFQRAPADFYEPGFMRARQAAIQQQFDALSVPSALGEQVLTRFESKRGLQNPMVNWRHLDEELLQLALERIPLADWLAIFNRLFSDTRLTRNGLPDLILFPHDAAIPYQLIEVKGPGDVLQKNQQRWMSFFAENDIDHRLCHIRWADNGTA